MSGKTVQENIGEATIKAVAEFARDDMCTVAQLRANEFSHVGDPKLRDTLAETYYGARWIYKLGLALLVRDAEQMAHVRTQVIDYGAVCEGLLSDCLLHALQTGRLQGQKHRQNYFKKPINWQVSDQLGQMMKQNFFWHIEVAREEGIIDEHLKDSLHKMRMERNTVHMRARARTHRAFLGTSRSLFETVQETIRQARIWRAANP